MKPHEKMRRRRNKVIRKKKFGPEFWVGVFIVALMVMSGFGIMLGGFGKNKGKPIDYNGTQFWYQQATRTFVAEKDGKRLEFMHMPSEVDSINLSSGLEEALRNTLEIDMTSDPDSPLKQEIALAIFYVQQSLQANSDTFVRVGFTEDNDYNITKITCRDATRFVPVFVFEYSNSTGIEEIGNCILLRGQDGEDMKRYASRILFAFYGIIK